MPTVYGLAKILEPFRGIQWNPEEHVSRTGIQGQDFRRHMKRLDFQPKS